MLTHDKFKHLDQSKPLQMLLDIGGMSYSTDWFDVYLHPSKDNVVLQGKEFGEIKVDQNQDLRNTPIRTKDEIMREFNDKVRVLMDNVDLELANNQEKLQAFETFNATSDKYK